MNPILALLAVLSVTMVSHASEFMSKNGFDLGYTSNANLTSEDPEGDMFYRIVTSNTLTSDNHSYGLRLGYSDYFTENVNDVLSLRLQDVWRAPRSITYRASVLGQYFPNGSSGTTESAFNSFGAEFSAAKDWERNSTLYGDWGGGYRFRHYPSFKGRHDHTGFVGSTLNYELSPKTELGAYGEVGLLFSSLGEYSRMYVDLGGTIEYKISSHWMWESDLSISQSYFVDRSVTTQTQVTNKRGRIATNTSETNEKYMLFAASSQLMKNQSSTFRWGGSFGVVNQDSTSGLQDYSALELLAKASVNF